MKWTSPPQGESSAPKWLKMSLASLYRLLCGLLLLGVFVLVGIHVFDIQIHVNTIRIIFLLTLTGGLIVITDAWRNWLLHLPVKTRFTLPVSYGYPGWRAIIQSQFASGCFLLIFGVLLFSIK